MLDIVPLALTIVYNKCLQVATRKRKLMQAVENTPHIYLEKGATLVLGTANLPH